MLLRFQNGFGDWRAACIGDVREIRALRRMFPMSRTISIISLFFSVSCLPQQVESAELLSIKLCAAQNYDEETKDCAPGKGLVGGGIEFDNTVVKKIYLLTEFRAFRDEEVHHVWFFNGKRLPQQEPTVWIEKQRSFIENISSELDWLRNQKEVGAVQAIAAVVKLIIKPSLSYKTKSSKILGPEWIGAWTVRVYAERPDQKPLGEMSFVVKCLGLPLPATP